MKPPPPSLSTRNNTECDRASTINPTLPRNDDETEALNNAQLSPINQELERRGVVVLNATCIFHEHRVHTAEDPTKEIETERE